MKTYFFLIFLLLIPAAAAFDCSYFADQTDCQAALTANENLIANLIYTNSSHPDHDSIAWYNDIIQVTDAPDGYEKTNAGVIKDAWLTMLTIQPSVFLNTTRYCEEDFTIRSEYSYWIEVPENYYNPNHGGTCKILHYLHENTSVLTKYANNVQLGTGKELTVMNYKQNATLTDELFIKGVIKNDYYEWEKYCCRSRHGRCTRWCWRCPYEYTDYTTNTLTLTDEKNTSYYDHDPTANFTLVAEYQGTTKALLKKDSDTSVWIGLPASNYTHQEYEYTANFTMKPYYLLELHATNITYEKGQNLLWNNGTFYTSNASTCTLTREDFFTTETTVCAENIGEEPSNPFSPPDPSTSWVFLLKLGVFALVNWFIYKGLKKYWGKLPGILGVFLLLLPAVHAEEECGLTNLASCIPEKIYDFILTVINAPLEPLLNLIKTLLESPPSIELFHGVWAIIVYCLSLFYGLLFLYSGYQFLFSGHNVIKREMAKEWLKNTVIMITLIQASYYLYGLILELGSTMTGAVLSMVNDQFFLITADNLINIGLEFLFVGTYALILFFTMLFLVGRYLIVAFGVIFAPIGVFCYFIPPLKSYGKLILNILGMHIFVVFLDAIIILACSQLILIPLFESIKIVVMINCFLIVDILFFVLAKHIISKSSFTDGAENIAQAAKYIAMFV
jgi:hypothetical protein